MNLATGRKANHSRVVLACTTFAATLAVEVLLVTLAGLAWLFFHPDPADNPAIRGGAGMLFVGVPMTFVIALLISMPVTYRMNRSGDLSRSDVIKLIGATSLTLGFVLAVPASGFASFWSLTYLASAFTFSTFSVLMLAPPSFCWWLLMQRDSAIRAGV